MLNDVDLSDLQYAFPRHNTVNLQLRNHCLGDRKIAETMPYNHLTVSSPCQT